MEEVKAIFSEGKGGFYLFENGQQIGEMIATIRDGEMIVHHTEVNPRSEGKGYAKQLLNAMAEYARANHLQVIPRCEYVHAQFRRHHELYADIWRPGPTS